MASVAWLTSACFNPRPPFPGGDALVRQRRPGDDVVSIHAPRFREAMRANFLLGTWDNDGFNPRPPFPGGDATLFGGGIVDSLVSIHAPRFREAMQLAVG